MYVDIFLLKTFPSYLFSKYVPKWICFLLLECFPPVNFQIASEISSTYLNSDQISFWEKFFGCSIAQLLQLTITVLESKVSKYEFLKLTYRIIPILLHFTSYNNIGKLKIYFEIENKNKIIFGRHISCCPA